MMKLKTTSNRVLKLTLPQREMLLAFNNTHVDLYGINAVHDDGDTRLIKAFRTVKLPGAMSWKDFFSLAEQEEHYRLNWSIKTMWRNFHKILALKPLG